MQRDASLIMKAHYSKVGRGMNEEIENLETKDDRLEDLLFYFNETYLCIRKSLRDDVSPFCNQLYLC